jgi:hypothetical protein
MKKAQTSLFSFFTKAVKPNAKENEIITNKESIENILVR